MKSKIYIFDLDGTLLDTLEDLYLAVNAAMEYCGYPPRTKEEVKSFVGNGIRMLLKRALPPDVREDGAVLDRAHTFFSEYYGNHCRDNTLPYDGILPVLRELRARGNKLAIVSNKADFAVKILSEEYFGKLIDMAVGENESAGVRKKPAPDSVFAVLDALGGDGAEAVYIGDADTDILTAANAGLPCISVSWGFRDRDFLLAHGAAEIIDRPEELLTR